MTRYTVHFTGRVQGVGFRATTRAISRNFIVAGQVRNLPDGRVLLIAQGSPQELDAFLKAILTQMASFIRHHTLDITPPSNDFPQPTPGGIVITY